MTYKIFISLIKKEHPDKKIILGGHSSGGSLALRYAAKHKDIDALLLLTPYLGHDAPTTRTNNILGAAITRTITQPNAA